VNIKLAGEIPESIVDGPGIRYTVFTQGCPHNCFGCHNPNTHDPKKGYYKDNDEIIKAIKTNPLIKGLTISGGEPFMQVEQILELTKKAKVMGLNVLIYTGYTYEELISKDDENIRDLLLYADYLVDGPFQINKKSYDLEFKGSSNQRLIDLTKTNQTGKIVEKSFVYS
jgi:anaerobic ribonucleoside-triphosphate reductase activating protein